MSSRTAACGQPPVSMATMRSGSRAELRVRNSASSLKVREGRGLVEDGGNWGRGGNVPSEDIVRHGCDIVFVSKGEAELEHQSCFSRSDGSELVSFVILLLILLFFSRLVFSICETSSNQPSI